MRLRRASMVLPLLLALIAVAATAAVYYSSRSTLKPAVEKSGRISKEVIKGKVTGLAVGYYLVEDPSTAIIRLQITSRPGPNITALRFRIETPAGVFVVTPTEIYGSKLCLDSKGRIIPGRECYLAINATEIFSYQAVLFNKNFTIVQPYFVGYDSSINSVVFKPAMAEPSSQRFLPKPPENSSDYGIPQIRFSPVAVLFDSSDPWSSCAILANGRVYCWGRNDYGQLGLGDLNQRILPAAVNLEDVKKVVLGRIHACALLANGSVYCWGDNTYGELGVGAVDYCGEKAGNYYVCTRPVAVKGLDKPVADLAVGYYHTCAVLVNGTTYCWGWADVLGMGTEDPCGETVPGTTVPICTLPRPVPNLTDFNVTQVVSGKQFTVALLSNGTAYCWGDNSMGSCGIGSNSGTDAWLYYPKAVKGLKNISLLRAGHSHVFALLANGSVYSWGSNLYGELCLGYTNNTPTPSKNGELLPRPVKALEDLGTNVTDFALGSWFTLILLENGTVLGCGDNTYGELGQGYAGEGTNSSLPVALPYFGKVEQIAAGFYHGCGLTASRSLYCWGHNSWGELGLGDVSNRASPTLVTFFEAFKP